MLSSVTYKKENSQDILYRIFLNRSACNTVVFLYFVLTIKREINGFLRLIEKDRMFHIIKSAIELKNKSQIKRRNVRLI